MMLERELLIWLRDDRLLRSHCSQQSDPVGSVVLWGGCNAEEHSGHRHAVDSWGGTSDRSRVGAGRRLEVVDVMTAHGQVRDGSRTPGYKWV
jgi:hypothetical protein